MTEHQAHKNHAQPITPNARWANVQSEAGPGARGLVEASASSSAVPKGATSLSARRAPDDRVTSRSALGLRRSGGVTRKP